jgi:hypothetical protein
MSESDPPSTSNPPLQQPGAIQTVGLVSFTMLGFIFGAVVGVPIEGDSVGALHVGLPAALLAFVFARTLLFRPGSG